VIGAAAASDRAILAVELGRQMKVLALDPISHAPATTMRDGHQVWNVGPRAMQFGFIRHR
jgi:hypothetical protein